MFADHPLTGVGPQVYDVLNGAYGIENPQWTIAHNAYAQVLADIGLVGAAALLVGGWLMVRSMVRAWQIAAPQDRLILAACIAAIVATLVHGLSDSPPTWNVALLPFAMVLAIAMRFVPEPAVKPRGISRAPSFVGLALIPLIVVGWSVMDGAHSHYDKSISASAAGDMQAAAQQAIEAVDGDPHSLVYKLQAGISLVALSQDERAAAIWPGALQQGIEYLRGAIEEDPHNGMAYANLGLALQMAGDNEGAAEAAHRALVETQKDATIAIVAGSIFEHAGMTDEAVFAYGAAMDVDPSLAQSPYWGTSGERQDLRSQALVASGLDACELGYEAGLYGVYVDDLPSLTSECRSIVDASGGQAKRPDLALMLFKQGKTDEAKAEANETLKSLGRTPVALVMSAIVLSDGNLTQARSDLFDARARTDAAALLGYTFGASPASSPALDVSLPQRDEEMPRLVEKRLGAIVPSYADSVDEAMTSYQLGRFYYSHIALREAPQLKIILGEWAQVVSPNMLLAFDALHAR
jgi:tetratricopeptide (TPR) repeat protein